MTRSFLGYICSVSLAMLTEIYQALPHRAAEVLNNYMIFAGTCVIGNLRLAPSSSIPRRILNTIVKGNCKQPRHPPGSQQISTLGDELMQLDDLEVCLFGFERGGCLTCVRTSDLPCEHFVVCFGRHIARRLTSIHVAYMLRASMSQKIQSFQSIPLPF